MSTMKIWIPKCGDAVVLDASWNFMLHDEHRNAELWKALSTLAREREWNTPRAAPFAVTFIAGTELVFDRIYIRQNNDEFASVTFIVKNAADENLIGCRFWVKLEDVNTMECHATSVDNPVGGFAKAQYKAALKEKKDPALLVKKNAAKATKLELDRVREECSLRCGGQASEPLSPHVQKIINKAAAIPYPHAVFVANTIYDHPDNIRNMMQSDSYSSYRRHCSSCWYVAKTTKLSDGSITRDVRFCIRGKKLGGFTVVTVDGHVTQVTALE